MLRQPDIAHAAVADTIDQAIAAKLPCSLELCAQAVNNARADIGDQDNEQIWERNVDEEALGRDGDVGTVT